MKNQIQALMEKEMSRVEFLQHVGAALLVAIGLSSFVKTLLQQGQTSAEGGNYNDSFYGGIGQ